MGIGHEGRTESYHGGYFDQNFYFTFVVKVDTKQVFAMVKARTEKKEGC